jgi:hypothetical protein
VWGLQIDIHFPATRKSFKNFGLNEVGSPDLLAFEFNWHPRGSGGIKLTTEVLYQKA